MTPEAWTPVILTSCVSVRSASVNVIAPLAVSGVAEPWVSAFSEMAAVCGSLVISTVSLLPVTVTMIGLVTTPPCPSLTVAV